MLKASGAHEPSDAVDRLINNNLLEFYGPRVGISHFGIRSTLLVEALNGSDIHEIFRKLRQLDNKREMYELVREGMTRHFFQSLIEEPRFGRIYFCSPWINPTDRDMAILRYALNRMEERQGYRPEVLVISQPPKNAPQGTRDGLIPFKEINASIFFNTRLHSKLYIREPDSGGGHMMAIVGSQNLTRSMNIELGIRINDDSRMISQLIRYFFELVNQSEEIGEGDE